MTIRWQALLVIGACAAPPRPAHPPIAARAPTTLAPALLDDADLVVRARARVAHGGAIRFEVSGAVLPPDSIGEPEVRDAHVVAAENGARVQLRVDGDDARLLVWVERADLATVVVKAQALLDRATGARGAVARPGAVIRRLDDGDVEIDDGDVVARGGLPSSVLGTVYDERPAREPAHDGLVAPTTMRASPAPGARPIATIEHDVAAHALAPAHDGWIELEIDRPWLYARGFVPVTAFERGAGAGSGYGSAASYAMTDTATLILPSGACLYAREDGPIIGVNTAERLRYAQGGDAPGWRRVAISTDWGLIWPAVHFPEKRGVPAGDFDRCPTRPTAAP